MPAWWSKKSSKNKDDNQHHNSSSHHFNFIKFATSKADNNDSNTKKSSGDDQKRAKSLDNVALTRNSPRESRDFSLNGAGSSGFSGFDSDSADKRGHPLPRPSVSSDHGVGLGSASASVSSVSSSGSSDDHVVAADHTQFGAAYRCYGDGRVNLMAKSPGRGGSRGPTSPTSPLHPRLYGASVVESPSGQCHRLPLPPGSPTSPPTSRTDNTLSNWKKGKLLGRGTFGHVYLGFNSEKGQMCAIKEVRLCSDDQTSKESLKQLNQEINLLSQLQHPNIVRYYGSELSEETLSVYLEYVSGGSIHKLLQEYGPFREPVIQTYTRQILLGLAYLHARNTVHRDIKGANILVDPNGEIKLVDFGMAKHMNTCSSMLSFKGSPYWMAPEVVMNTNGYSLKVDIWSLGCTVLEMATSKPPWSQYEGVAAIFKIGNSKDVPDIPDHLSSDAKSFIKLCLQREPSARPTASQLLDHPFVCDQGTGRAAGVPIAKDSFPYTFDGSRTPPVLDLHPARKSFTLCEGDYTTKPISMTSRTLNNPRENVRMSTLSLPVSPCSSPLRQHGSAHKSCFLSPTHLAYPVVGQTAYNLGEYSGYAMKSNTRSVHDPLFEPSLLKARTPGTSPRRRPI